MSKWWWPFGGKKRAERQETEQRFRSMLNEALLSQDDLAEAIEELKRAREGRIANVAEAPPRKPFRSQPT